MAKRKARKKVQEKTLIALLINIVAKATQNKKTKLVNCKINQSTRVQACSQITNTIQNIHRNNSQNQMMTVIYLVKMTMSTAILSKNLEANNENFRMSKLIQISKTNMIHAMRLVKQILKQDSQMQIKLFRLIRIQNKQIIRQISNSSRAAKKVIVRQANRKSMDILTQMI